MRIVVLKKAKELKAGDRIMLWGKPTTIKSKKKRRVIGTCYFDIMIGASKYPVSLHEDYEIEIVSKAPINTWGYKCAKKSPDGAGVIVRRGVGGGIRSFPFTTDENLEVYYIKRKKQAK